MGVREGKERSADADLSEGLGFLCCPLLPLTVAACSARPAWERAVQHSEKRAQRGAAAKIIIST